MSDNSEQQSPCLATLPGELLAEIVNILTFDDWVALASTSKVLLHRMEPFVLAASVERDRALVCASRRGYVPLMRRAISLGANVRTPMICNRKDTICSSWLHPVLALRVSVKSGNMHGFQLLVDHGASLDAFAQITDKFPYSQKRVNAEIDRLFWVLARPDRMAFLRRFCDDPVLPSLSQLHLQACLRHVVGRSLDKGRWHKDAMELLIEKGAKARDLQTPMNRDMCPVAIAINRGYVDIAEELVKLGCDVHGKKPRPGIQIEWPHVPIFAAAMKMAEEGPAMVERLLKLGADPYHEADISIHPRRQNDSGHYPKETVQLNTLLPIHIYVASIDWSTDASVDHLEGLWFWKSFGRPVPQGVAIFQRHSHDMAVPYMSLHYLMLAKWGPNLLANDSFYDFMKELESELSDWELSEVVKSVDDDRAFRRPEGVALERWKSLFNRDFPAPPHFG